jgi:hypothetical protein
LLVGDGVDEETTRRAGEAGREAIAGPAGFGCGAVFGVAVLDAAALSEEVFGAVVFGAVVFGAVVFGAVVFGAVVFGAAVVDAVVFAEELFATGVLGDAVLEDAADFARGAFPLGAVFGTCAVTPLAGGAFALAASAVTVLAAARFATPDFLAGVPLADSALPPGAAAFWPVFAAAGLSESRLAMTVPPPLAVSP